MAWGQGGFKSCDALLKRVEDNDDKLVELVILPMKTFGASEVERLSNAIANGKNTRLQTISASGHHLSPESLKRFGLALSTQAQTLINEGKSSGGITHLAIGSKDMGDEGVIALCEGLAPSSGGMLQSFDLGWKNLGKDGLRAIGSTFASSKFLTSIDLSRNNAIGSEGISSLCDAAKENIGDDGVAFPSLEQLTLSECNIGPPGIQCLSEIILGSSSRPKQIHLAISSNPIGSEGCRSLSNLCASSKAGSMLSHLQLAQCSIGDEGIKLLSTAATSTPCIGLHLLDISENAITKDGAKVFADSLVESWPDLKELKLAKNDIGGEGVASVMGSLLQRKDVESDVFIADGKNTTLTNLDLTSTNCGINGAKAALMSRSLATLRLFNNKLGSDGFQSISSLLQGGHPSIENLDLGGNSAEEESVVALLNAIADIKDDGSSSSKLSVLEIGGNKFGDVAAEALQNLKRVWPRLDVAHDKPVQEGDDSQEGEDE